MVTLTQKFGIPNIELGCSTGGKINPSSFAGHDLVVLFGPEEPAACAREVAAYRQHRDKFARHDAWLLAFTDETIEPPCGPADGRILTIADPDRRAWTAFRDLTRHAEEMDRASGATFLFTRGGGLHRYWHGSGHVDDVLAELRTPSSEHPHQQV